MNPRRLLIQFAAPMTIVGVLVFLGIVFSHHGLLDLRKFERQLNATRDRVAQVEEENRKLRRQLDLLDESSQQVLERKAREVFGWARPGEKIYLEPSFKN